MRLSDRLVFQEVDDGLYVLADSDGHEVKLTADEVARLHIGVIRVFVGRDQFITAAYERVTTVVGADKAPPNTREQRNA